MPVNEIDPLLKDVYGPAIREQLPNECPVLKLFEKAEDVQYEGRQIIEPFEAFRAGGFYYTAEQGPPPSAVSPQHELLRITPRFGYGGILVTKQEMNASRTSKGAFARAMRLKMDSLLKRVKRERNRILWGDGRGILAMVNGAATSTTQTFDNPGGIVQASNSTRYIQPNDWLGFVTLSTGALANTVSYQVATVPAAGLTLTFTASFTSIDNAGVVRAYGSDAALVLSDTSYMQEPMGLSGIVDNGTYNMQYFGASRAQFPVLNATVIGSVGALSADILQRAVDVTTQVAESSVQRHLMHPSVRRAYLAISEADRRYTLGKLINPDVGTAAAKGGYGSGLDFGGVPIEIDPDAPFGEWFGLNMDGAYRYPVDEGSWIDDDGSILFRSTTQVDTFEATWRIHDNFAHVRPNNCFRLTGITANLVTVHRF